MATPVEQPFQFAYPANARELPKKQSPLAQQYSTSDFKRWHISSAGVVVVDESFPTAP